MMLQVIFGCELADEYAEIWWDCVFIVKVAIMI
jgi:hypothetical protein